MITLKKPNTTFIVDFSPKGNPDAVIKITLKQPSASEITEYRSSIFDIAPKGIRKINIDKCNSFAKSIMVDVEGLGIDIDGEVKEINSKMVFTDVVKKYIESEYQIKADSWKDLIDAEIIEDIATMFFQSNFERQELKN